MRAVLAEMPEQVVLHEMAVAPRVRGGQAEELVQVEGGDVRQVKGAGARTLDELLVQQHGRATGRQAQHGMRCIPHGRRRQ